MNTTKLNPFLPAALAACLVLLLSSPRAARAQAAGEEVETVRVNTRLVQLTVRAVDSKGRPARLNSATPAVLADGVPQQIAYVEDSQPATVAVLFDTSASMTARKAERARRALAELVRGGDPRNRYLLFSFNDTVRGLGEFGPGDLDRMTRVLKALPAEGETALYDATIQAARVVGSLAGVRGKRALVVFTDGVDTSSRSLPRDAAAALDQMGGLVYVQILGSSLVLSSPERERDDGASARASVVLSAALNARPRVFYYEEDLYGASRAIGEDLVRARQLGFYPAGDAAGPGPHRVEIRFPEVTIRAVARTSYFIQQ
jgi:VWFA-related protein